MISLLSSSVVDIEFDLSLTPIRVKPKVMILVIVAFKG